MDVCEKLRAVEIRGNVVPIQWCDYIRVKKKNTPHLLAIMILADIVYWYRPVEVRDQTGRLIGWKKKFKDDLLQKSYADYSALFGVSKKLVKEAFDRLEELGLIERKFKTVEIKVNDTIRRINNVMFVALNVDEVLKITQVKEIQEGTPPQTDNTLPPKWVGGSSPNGGDKYIDYNKDYSIDYNRDNISQSISNKPIDSLDKNRKRNINNILQSDSNITNREVDKKSISNTPNREVNKQSISKLTNRLVNEKSVSNPSIDPIAKIPKAELESVWQEFDALISRFGNITNETRIRMAIIALGPEKTRSILSLAKGMPSLIDAIEVLRSNLPEEVDYATV